MGESQKNNNNGGYATKLSRKTEKHIQSLQLKTTHSLDLYLSIA